MRPASFIPRRGLVWLLHCILMALAYESAGAPLALAPYFSSNMVLQRGAKTRIWGTGKANGVVQVELAGESERGNVKSDGIWSVEFEKLKASDVGAVLTAVDIRDKQRPTLKLTNVLVGDILIVGITNTIGINIPSTSLGGASTPVRFLNLPKVVNEETIGQGGATGWNTPGPAKLSALALRTAIDFASRPDMKGVPLGIVVVDLLTYKGRLTNSANPDIPFPHEAWRAAKSDLKAGQNEEAVEFLKLKREGKRSDHPPLTDYRQMYFHLWEDFDPKNAPASVFKFKWVFTEY